MDVSKCLHSNKAFSDITKPTYSYNISHLWYIDFLSLYLFPLLHYNSFKTRYFFFIFVPYNL